MEKTRGEILRSFYYYDLILYDYNEDGAFRRIKNYMDMYYDAFSYIAKLRGKVEKGESDSSAIEVPTDGGDRVYIIVDKVNKGEPIEFRLVLCRSDALPYVENNGILDFLTKYLPKNFSLAEITHCVIFPEKNIMGAEFNFAGARATSIKIYLPKIFDKIGYVYCKNKLNSKVVDRLRKGEGFSLFQMGVRNDSRAMQFLMESKSIFSLPFTNIPDVDTFEIVLKKRKGKKCAGFESPMPISMMDDFISNFRDDIKSFKVSQGSIQGDAVDLLHDKLVRVCKVTKTINRTIDSKQAYHEIKTFFDTNVKFVF